MKKTTLAIIIAAALAGPAMGNEHSDSEPFYFHPEIGYLKLGGDCLDCDRSGSMFRLSWGYKTSEHVAVEAGGAFHNFERRGAQRTDNYYVHLGLRGTYPLSEGVSFTAIVAPHYYKGIMKDDDDPAFRVTRDGIELFYGGGLDAALSRHATLTAKYLFFPEHNGQKGIEAHGGFLGLDFDFQGN